MLGSQQKCAKREEVTISNESCSFQSSMSELQDATSETLYRVVTLHEFSAFLHVMFHNVSQAIIPVGC